MATHDLVAVYATSYLHTYHRLDGLTWMGATQAEVWEGETADDRMALNFGDYTNEPDPNDGYGDRAFLIGYQVPCALWGDYCGDDYSRSNHEALLRDFPEAFIRVSGDVYSHDLIVLPGYIDAGTDNASVLADVLQHLRDEYPLYDEDHHGNLLMDIERENWESWGRADFRSLVESAYEAKTGDELDADACPDGRLDDLFTEARQDAVDGFVCESADSGYWPEFDEAANEVARQLVEERQRAWDLYAADYIRVDGQASLPI